ncbi:hypothetical protein UFOVP273_4 [uncultured Caudovirales phage]|uniref:Uncharacterized protein n=1 Tax=uncultured Caudovirales phage TaxID=2100421 RepID=A0A6J5LKE7_9CAUD|nr:hypothetical protein UFOVP273_4 [uncultured Caudovirales phage]
MAKWVNSSVLDNGLNQIKNNATKMILISAYTAGDSYATVTGNALATVTMTGTDYTLSSSASNRVLTVAASKTATATATASGTPDLHIAFTDGTANVLWVTDETTNQPITSGNIVSFPSVTYTSNQPT